MIKLQLGGNNQQKITKVCNTCGTHIQDLEVEDIMVKSDTDLIIEDKDGKEVFKTGDAKTAMQYLAKNFNKLKNPVKESNPELDRIKSLSFYQ